MPPVVNEGFKCTLSYSIKNAKACTFSGLGETETLFNEHDGTTVSNSVDISPGSYLMECGNDDTVTAKTFTCRSNFDVREN